MVGARLGLAICGAMAVLLAGCASTPGEKNAAAVKDIPMESVIQSADGASASGDKEKALALLDAAAKANPADARPWLRMAQMHFDAANYPAAILAAEEAYKRDPSNGEAKSLALVSSLRVAVKYVTDLRADEKLQGNARSDAEQLAQGLRESLGAEVLVPSPAQPTAESDSMQKAKKAVARRKHSTATKLPAASAHATGEVPAASPNPFGMLK